MSQSQLTSPLEPAQDKGFPFWADKKERITHMDDAFFLRAAKKQEAGFMRVGMKIGNCQR